MMSDFLIEDTSIERLDKTKRKILVVDDDASIHLVTKSAIRLMDFEHYHVELLEAYSAKEARQLLQKQNDIAIALIDVVMETPNAGLDLVDYIRKTLNNEKIRVIIRTGQPNEAPEMEIIKKYDINDYKEKTELTVEKLYTVLRSSFKEYEHIIALENKYDDMYSRVSRNHVTGLPNRVRLNDDLGRDGDKVLVLIDIVGFSMINDTNGFHVGDAVLKQLGAFLQTMYDEVFSVYHLDADLFALIIPNDDVNHLENQVQTIRDDITQLNVITNSFNKSIDITIGVAYQSAKNVLQKAELALREARNAGKNQIKFYSEDLKIIRTIQATHYWSEVISESLSNGQMKPYFQPIYNAFTMEIDKYEVLVRIENEEGVHLPSEFLHAAQNSGQLFDIFKLMFTKACEKSVETGKRFSVNVGDSELVHPDIYDFIANTMKNYSITQGTISLEVLEYRSISHDEEIKMLLNRIYDLGIEIIIDDFGVQCSNFGQLQELPIKTLKIDGSFIKDICENEDSKIIVTTIQTFAKLKDIKLVAEFVHCKEVCDKVKELGIEYLQGFYLAKPEPELQ